MTERKRAERELGNCAEQLRALSQQLAEVREDERRRLAQELHDRVGQNLTALDLNLNIIRGALPPEVLARVGERLGDCLRLVEHTVEVVSDVMAELLDIAMSELNGIEATVQVRQACPSVRVLILSMHSTLEHVREALKAGAQGYLLKKSAGTEVVEAVRVVHAEGAYLSQKIAGTMIADYHDQHPESPLDALSRRERQILQLIVEGKSNLEASRSLFLSPKTVETYRCRMMQKLGVTRLPRLMKFAVHHGIAALE